MLIESFLFETLGSELVFIVYPHTIALMDWSTLWAILFFFMLITLGIDSTVSVGFFLFGKTKYLIKFSLVVLNQLLRVYVMNFRIYLDVIDLYLSWVFLSYAI